jgi:peptidoglycan/LPS O-acetylase OafA/YrhL
MMSESSRAQRFVFIDGLRGFAALAVVFYHLVYNTHLTDVLLATLPKAVSSVAFEGSLGVKVFFVISGFVIAYSLRSTRMTTSEVGNFVIRRQLRLDPPYWTVLIIVLVQSWAGRMVPSPTERPLPTFGETALNFVYLQKILGSRELLGVAWTLCIEIQYYVSFVLLLIIAAVGRNDRFPRLSVAVFLATSTGIASAFLRPNFIWFGSYWHYFTAGALCVWALESNRSLPLVGLIVQTLAVSCIAFLKFSGELASYITGLTTVWVIYFLGRVGRLTTMLGNQPVQYFGRISYSLYLVHLPVLMVVMQVGEKLTGQRGGFAVLWMIAAGLASIAAADIFYRIIERPSVRLASKLKRHRPPPAAIQATAPTAAS